MSGSNSKQTEQSNIRKDIKDQFKYECSFHKIIQIGTFRYQQEDLPYQRQPNELTVLGGT
ncbi:hypothetical protein RvY_15110 [Ramazzottius varieornatus]|uniref:Uncharacterized protein n=1 Tax=Ramazzottius varieornatus TaxID=947166 RepID=A0A1D1VTQ5_RAMVA|nr:hypothetical protein RvY_15110 [Ramazzottius varieornatus]